MSELSRRHFLIRTSSAAGMVSLAGLSASGKWSPNAAADSASLTAKAVIFLRNAQDADGSWSTGEEPGITGLVLTALLRSRRVTPNEPVITKGLAFLDGIMGDVATPGKIRHSSYATCVALMAYYEANRKGEYAARIKAAQQFLRSTQFDESNGTTRENPFYGGAGYGPGGSSAPAAAKKADATKKAATKSARLPRPDLSNTAFMIEALRDTGVREDDPAMKKAIVFISRCQNLKGEFNDQPWAEKVNDGGFIYTPANGGTSVAGKDDAGGLRSYASMTYAGLRSLIYAGLTADDPRVKAAQSYITKHYSVEENPGLDQRGLYYYYQAFAKTLAALGKPAVVDSEGKSHDWRADLVGALAKRQNENGSWVNATESFMEGDPNLVTSYALLALAYAAPKS